MRNVEIERLSHERIPYENTPDPLIIFKTFKGKGNGFLLESADRCGEIGRFSLIGIEPIIELEATGAQIRLRVESEIETFEGNPFDVMEALLKHNQEKIGDLPFSSGGLAGWIGYDAIRHIETIPQQHKEAEMADIHLMLPRSLMILDRDEKCIDLITFGVKSSDVDQETEQARHFSKKELEGFLETGQFKSSGFEETLLAAKDGLSAPDLVEKWTSKTSKETFKKSVATAKDHIQKGDTFQLVFSRRLTKETEIGAEALYETLRHINPSPYMFIVDTDKTQVVGASPETMVHLKSGKVTIHPIAGTRPRGSSEAEDIANEVELIEDVKENAEHLMLVDLARNDIGRIAKFGSVEVPKFKTVERFSHVMHIVSEVTGKVDSEMSAIDVFKSCFPAGTVSGAPKIMAMKIIDANEPVRRGVYAGAVGWIATSGDIDTCIAIRTAVLSDGNVSIQAGGGIVQDSEPEFEFMETVHKSGSIMQAVHITEKIACLKETASSTEEEIS